MLFDQLTFSQMTWCQVCFGQVNGSYFQSGWPNVKWMKIRGAKNALAEILRLKSPNLRVGNCDIDFFNFRHQKV